MKTTYFVTDTDQVEASGCQPLEFLPKRMLQLFRKAAGVFYLYEKWYIKDLRGPFANALMKQVTCDADEAGAALICIPCHPGASKNRDEILAFWRSFGFEIFEGTFHGVGSGARGIGVVTMGREPTSAFRTEQVLEEPDIPEYHASLQVARRMSDFKLVQTERSFFLRRALIHEGQFEDEGDRLAVLAMHKVMQERGMAIPPDR